MPEICIRLFVLVVVAAAASIVRADPPPSPLARAVQPYVDRHEIAGAVMMVADREGVVAVQAVGMADIGAGRALTPDSVFWIASQTKAMTAAALMMLVDDGKVALDDPVAKFLPEFGAQRVIASREGDTVTLKKPDRPVTVRDVLSHMSGLPFRSAIEEPTLDILPLRTRATSYAMTPLQSEPGARYSYSNAGINTAAQIVEVVSGKPFEVFLDERLLRPLKMMDTTWWPGAEQLARLAHAYKPGPDGTGLVETPIAQLRYPLDDRVTRTPMPGGGLFSTARDVSRFYRMLLRGGELDGVRVLSEQAVQAMTSRQTPPHVNESYGLGLSVNGDGFGHGGAYHTDTWADGKTGRVYIWLTQHAAFPGRGGEAHGAFRNAAAGVTRAGEDPAAP